jgi:hypothetical protein
VKYLNSGDWIENLTSLEYNDGQWRVFNFRNDYIEQPEMVIGDHEKMVDVKVTDLFKNMLVEFHN